MGHSFCFSLYHCVFSTKERRKTIDLELEDRLWPYLGGIAREHGMKALAVGGMDDHVHLLLSLPSNLAVANALRVIKSGSSRWLHEACNRVSFEWQEGYGAFSIGQAQVEAHTMAYIAHQKEHHRQHDFQAEFLAFLEKHCMEYDLRYVWG